MRISDHPFDILKRCGARKRGHFVLSSWRHSDEYVDKSELSVIPRLTSALCLAVSDRYRGKGIQVVAGPALGAVIPSWEIARLLTLYEERDVRHVILEKNPAAGAKKFKLGRGHARHVAGQPTLLFEDIATSGDSVAGGLEALVKAGAIVEEIAFMWNRGGVTAEKLGVPSVYSLIEERLEDWSEEECPLCAQNIAVDTELGRGVQFNRWLDVKPLIEELSGFPDVESHADVRKEARRQLEFAKEGGYDSHPKLRQLSQGHWLTT